MKYDIYFTDLTHMGVGINSKAFPLSIGILAAYTAKEFGDQVQIDLFKFPDDFNTALRNKVPDFLCMSNYCFNLNLSYAFVEYVKKSHPEVIIIWGGPNFPTTPEGRKDFMIRHPMIDFYIKWNGEVALVNLLERLMQYDLKVDRFKKDKIISENCCYFIGNDYIEGPDHRVMDFSILPSPYTTGYMDKFFGHSFNPLIETTRGCPYGCTFCNSGHLFNAKIMRKPKEIIAEELEYIASKVEKTAELWFCDDNFGMYKEDIETSHIISSIIDKYDWPYYINTSNGKSHPERIVESRSIINGQKEGVLRYGFSLQSADDEVLQNIKRKNLSTEGLLQLAEYRYNERDYRTDFFTELILGMPGQTLDKHYESLKYSIDTIGVSNIDIHQLNLFMGAEMLDSDDHIKYQLDKRYRIFIGAFGIYKIGMEEVPCAEIDETVVSSNSLSFDDYLQCRIMNLLVKIYIDHDPFKEVLGLIRRLKLSVFDLLLLIKEEFLNKCDSLNLLIEDFVTATQKPLFECREDVERFVSHRSNVEKYISGELGTNELLYSKARAFLECNDDLHLVLQESVLCYLRRNNLLTQELEEYVKQAVKYSKLKKFDFNKVQEIKEDSFTFDFIKAGEFGYKVDPDKIKVDRIDIKFYHDQKTLEYINKRIDKWGKDSLVNIGKLLQKTNMELMSRRTCFAGDPVLPEVEL